MVFPSCAWDTERKVSFGLVFADTVVLGRCTIVRLRGICTSCRIGGRGKGNLSSRTLSGASGHRSDQTPLRLRCSANAWWTNIFLFGAFASRQRLMPLSLSEKWKRLLGTCRFLQKGAIPQRRRSQSKTLRGLMHDSSLLPNSFQQTQSACDWWSANNEDFESFTKFRGC